MTSETSPMPAWFNGEPYYCAMCGAGGADRMACEQPDCVLETREAAQARAETFGTVTPADLPARLAELAQLESTARMLALYAPNPLAPGERWTFDQSMLHATELALVGAFFPLRELCSHREIDRQALLCQVCGAEWDSEAELPAAVISATWRPFLYAACRAIDYDNGGHLIGTLYPGEPLGDTVTIPGPWRCLVWEADDALGRLAGVSPADFQTFACGEESEAEAIAERQGDLATARRLLNDYFENWPAECAPHLAPHCPYCGRLALGGHVTCGNVKCDELATWRAAAWAARRATDAEAEAATSSAANAAAPAPLERCKTDAEGLCEACGARFFEKCKRYPAATSSAAPASVTWADVAAQLPTPAAPRRSCDLGADEPQPAACEACGAAAGEVCFKPGA